ncbi:hypothetical protein F5J12DRAFT_812015 [Pisolithus orientalis]|uniref:uncharacterized protein n=1 Tax=Pisolithus orientalis TaxID=936130 RepID=UPI0022245D56|nr:uncharacterized protein F5J12DRAFT_812015 [Pisolithus orientalis]KAI6019618.1 hypothetical protein F5J12DRAFT_812015 [Pisolithus orientalis]
MTMLDTDQRLREARTAALWKRGTMGADIEHYSSRVCFSFMAFFLQLSYSRENGHTRRSMTEVLVIAIRGSTMDYERAMATVRRETMTTTVLDAERWPCEAGTTVLWRRAMTSTATELDGSMVCLDFNTLCLQLPYSRKNGCTRQRLSDIQAAAM